MASSASTTPRRGTGRVAVRIWVRLLAAVLMTAAGLTTPELDPRAVVVGTGAYLLTTSVLWFTPHRRFTGASLGLLDVVYLQWATYLTGGFSGPGPYLLVLHAIIAALIGTDRDGVRAAVAHGVALLLVDQAISTGVLGEPAAAPTGTRSLVIVMTALWLGALTTAWLSAVNERELRQRRRDLELQAELATRLARADTPGAVTEALLDYLDVSLGDPRALVVDVSGEVPAGIGARRVASPLPTPLPLRPAAVLQRCSDQRRTLLVRTLDPIDDVWLTMVIPEARNLTLVPLVVQERTSAVLVVEHGVRAGSSLETRVVGALERAADHTALALTTVRLRGALTEHAMTDGLTGVANRRSFDTTLERELARADRTGGRVSLLLLDLDHFKKLNDEFGHSVGDDVLAATASQVESIVRPMDLVARYGGEEFAVILPDTETTEAAAAGERIRHAVSQVTAPDGRPVTASVGVAMIAPEDGLDADLLIRRADDALYRAKNAGRNKVVVNDASVVR